MNQAENMVLCIYQLANEKFFKSDVESQFTRETQ
jgi:hypothetical protein